MIRSALPIFKGGTKRGRNPLKLLGGAGKMAARGAQTLYARSPVRSASGALAPVTPKPTAPSSTRSVSPCSPCPEPKALEYKLTPIAAVMLGAISGAGGYTFRDILL